MRPTSSVASTLACCCINPQANWYRPPRDPQVGSKQKLWSEKNTQEKTRNKIFTGLSRDLGENFVYVLFSPKRNDPIKKQINKCLAPTQSRDNPANLFMFMCFLALKNNNGDDDDDDNGNNDVVDKNDDNSKDNDNENNNDSGNDDPGKRTLFF